MIALTWAQVMYDGRQREALVKMSLRDNVAEAEVTGVLRQCLGWEVEVIALGLFECCS